MFRNFLLIVISASAIGGGAFLLMSALDKQISEDRPGPARVTDLAFVSEGANFVTATYDGKVRLWNSETGDLIRHIGSCEPWNGRIAVSPDGRSLVTAFQSMQFWDIESTAPIREFVGHKARINCVMFASNDVIVSGGSDNMARVWNTDGREVFCLEHQSDVRDLATIPDGVRLLTASGGYTSHTTHDSAFRCWDLLTGELVFRIDNGQVPVTTLGVSGSGELVAVGDDEGVITVWNANEWEIIHTCRMEVTTYNVLPIDVSAIEFTPDDRYLICGGGDRRVSQDAPQTIQVWDLQTGEQIDCFSDYLPAVRCMDLSHDGKRLLTGHGYIDSDDSIGGLRSFNVEGVVRVWDAGTYSLMHTCEVDE